MNIIETEYADVSLENLDKAKVILSDKIVSDIYPLFDEIHIGKSTESSDLETVYNSKKKKLKEEKEEIEELMKSYNKEKKVKKLLNRISKLVSSGLVYDSNLKMETIVLLKIINKLPEEKLDFQLSEMMKVISKRFSRV